MCGIVGYVGPKNAVPILVSGLEKLEYRGYDSAGVATVESGRIEVYRAEGKLAKLKTLLQSKGRLSVLENGGSLHVGIGHTRWATHGRPSETNAHPHVTGKVAVVHNGIIENYLELRKHLQQMGYTFASETDTEVVAALINSHLKNTKLLDAVRKALAEIQGSYALAVISTDDPDTLVVARNANPLVIGLSENETYVASDIPAILNYTRRVLVLEDGEIAEVRPNSVIVEKDSVPVSREPLTVTWDPVTAEKGGYRHFMLKEIHEQPQVVTETFRGRVDLEQAQIVFGDFEISDRELKNIDRVHMIACGTAWHAALVTKFYIERLARVPVEVDYGSEFRYRSPIINSEKNLFVAISQSGETADTIGSLKLATEMGALTLAICNVVGSTIARHSKAVIYTHAGPEISVASTKAFVTQLTVGLLFALHMARVRGTLSEIEMRSHLEELVHLPAMLCEALTFDKHVEQIAKKYGKSSGDHIFLGRGILYPIALEGALKLKEISYIHAEGFPAGEMKHGPIALIGEDTPVVVVIGHDGVNYEKTLSNLKEAESRGGKIIAVTDKTTEAIEDLAEDLIAIGNVPTLLLPIVTTIPLQLLAYHTAVCRGTDVDQPRNLAKSVTVE